MDGEPGTPWAGNQPCIVLCVSKETADAIANEINQTLERWLGPNIEEKG